ncbi:methyltransferase [Nocardioides gilvus]|uniref:methyltransferase n=1 Tax=Nocardioides gilvus TaxID=1735589 RepID=UPI000D7494AA|nr:methyltransferase [Nocardioides gilvus]
MEEAIARNVVLAVPLLLVAVAAVRVRLDLVRRVPAAFLAGLWVWVAVLAVEVGTDWWTFAPAPTSVGGVPLEISLGWALLWGAVPVLVGGPLWVWLLAFAWIDLLGMDRLPGLELHDGWLWGELLLLAVAAGPGLALGWATRHRRWLWLRVGLQAVLFTAAFFWLLPHLVLTAEGSAWADVVDHSYLVRSVLLVVAVLVFVPAVAAVVELGHAGGTPFPWDPPARLVTTGPFAYVANPMQIGMSGLMVLLAVAAGSPGLGAAAVFAIAFSVVLAERQEHAALSARWAAYETYRTHVRAWWPRWRPYVPSPRTLWVSETCELCAATGATLQALGQVGLETHVAEEAPHRVPRMEWSDGETVSSGVAAFARALEHTTLVWAWLGWWMRLPGVGWVLQLIADACGLGPRELPRRETTPRSTVEDAG